MLEARVGQLFHAGLFVSVQRFQDHFLVGWAWKKRVERRKGCFFLIDLLAVVQSLTVVQNRRGVPKEDDCRFRIRREILSQLAIVGLDHPSVDGVYQIFSDGRQLRLELLAPLGILVVG